MLQRNTKNIVYFASKTKKTKSQDELFSKEKLDKILDILQKQSLKEKTLKMEDLESILQNKIYSNTTSEQHSEDKVDSIDGITSITKYLMQTGYLKDQKNWLTHKGFFEIGNKILRDIIKDLQLSDIGFHETKYVGKGNVVIDSTKRFEPGDDIKHLSVSQTLLNSINRLSKYNSEITFPIKMTQEDLEAFETLEDVRIAIVYCIDLSSTMKTILGNNISRIEAAKKALWSLYVMNNKFFPTDSIFVVGFASMASSVNPFDIPFLKTFDANDNFLHYTNYQAALRLARKILGNVSVQHKKIIMITDGQPSACFVENEYQKNDIISDKPYSNFYAPDSKMLSKILNEKNMKLDISPERLVYLCYRYKKVDPKIDHRTVLEAKKCLKEGIQIDTIVISDEIELLEYAQHLEKIFKGKTFHIKDENMETVLMVDYLNNIKKVIQTNQI